MFIGITYYSWTFSCHNIAWRERIMSLWNDASQTQTRVFTLAPHFLSASQLWLLTFHLIICTIESCRWELWVTGGLWVVGRKGGFQTIDRQMRMGGPWKTKEKAREEGRESTLSGFFSSVVGLKVDLSAVVLRDLFCVLFVWRSKHKVKHPVFGKRVRYTAWQSHVCALMLRQTRTHRATLLRRNLLVIKAAV